MRSPPSASTPPALLVGLLQMLLASTPAVAQEISMGAEPQNVTASVQTALEPAKGTPFLATLSRDGDQDETFDLVFVDENRVEDEAVFEGTTMIAHVIKAP